MCTDEKHGNKQTWTFVATNHVDVAADGQMLVQRKAPATQDPGRD